MVHQINGTQFAEMIVSASAAIEMARQAVNELNVFPVPDGDTGTNMSLTMNKAATEIRRNMSEEVGRAAVTVAEGLLHGARGNSGVILSLLFRGFARRVKEHTMITGLDLAEALSEGVDAAYHAVMKPTEGTILTVSRLAAARAKSAAEEDSSVEYVLAQALEAAELALEETIHQNPVLAKAGVVDAGGKGYCIILDGMLSALQGRAPEALPLGEDKPRDKADFTEYSSEDIRYPYCTEFIVSREGKRNPLKLHAFLSSLGDSLVFVDDEKIIKAHIHTENPGKILEEALKYGALHSVKIENMRIQHTEQSLAASENAASERTIAPAERRYGFVAVCAGEGMARVFSDLGVDRIVSGGQTMNPSTQELLAAIDKCPSEIVFVLPNNKNIIMAAEQAVPLSEKTVIVLPSRFVPQGMSAMLAFDPAGEPEANREAMMDAISGVNTGQVTYAARESVFDGNSIREGDHMALLNGQLIGTRRERADLLTLLAAELEKYAPTYIILFRGEGVTDNDAEEARSIFQTRFPGAEVDLLDGGQPVYSFVISAE